MANIFNSSSGSNSLIAMTCNSPIPSVFPLRSSKKSKTFVQFEQLIKHNTKCTAELFFMNNRLGCRC